MIIIDLNGDEQHAERWLRSCDSRPFPTLPPPSKRRRRAVLQMASEAWARPRRTRRFWASCRRLCASCFPAAASLCRFHCHLFCGRASALRGIKLCTAPACPPSLGCVWSGWVRLLLDLRLNVLDGANLLQVQALCTLIWMMEEVDKLSVLIQDVLLRASPCSDMRQSVECPALPTSAAAMVIDTLLQRCRLHQRLAPLLLHVSLLSPPPLGETALRHAAG